MFGIIDTNPTLQIISADWIEEYYDDQYLALLLRKKQNLISEETGDGGGYGSGSGIGIGWGDGYGYCYGNGIGYGSGYGYGSGDGNGNSD